MTTWPQLMTLLNDNPALIWALASAIAAWIITNVCKRLKWLEGVGLKKLTALFWAIITATVSVAATGAGWDTLPPTAIGIWIVATFVHGLAKKEKADA